MRSVSWKRADAIDAIRDDVWRFVSQAAVDEPQAELEAAALLQMTPHEVRTLAAIQFINSSEVAALLDQMPFLIRRLCTSTISEEEIAADRVRGSIQWAATFSARAASGLPHLYVTAPARRAYDTPENAVLVFALDAIQKVGKRTGWHRSTSPTLGQTVRDRVTRAERWLATRTLSEIHPVAPSPQTVARVRAGRAARRYRVALDVLELYIHFVRRSDRDALRMAVQDNALVTSRDDVLLELWCGFAIERGLRDLGWRVARPGLVSGGRFLEGERRGDRLDLYYQHTPRALGADSLYREVQRSHGFKVAGQLTPDYVLELRTGGGQESRWVLIEVKGLERPVTESARAALLDLLAYRRAFEPVLSSSAPPYGLGVAWGQGATPSPDAEICLCTPDTISVALERVLAP
jgi:hypothetical protein